MSRSSLISHIGYLISSLFEGIAFFVEVFCQGPEDLGDSVLLGKSQDDGGTFGNGLVPKSLYLEIALLIGTSKEFLIPKFSLRLLTWPLPKMNCFISVSVSCR